MIRKIDDDLLLKLKSEGVEQKEIAKRFNCSGAAVSKRLRRLEQINPPASLTKLTDKQQKYALSVASGKTQTQAALDSYECSSMDSAKNIGSRLARDPDVRVAIYDLMSQEGITRRHRISRLKEHINCPDRAASLKALDMSFRLDGLYVEKVEISEIFNITHELKRVEEIDIGIKKMELELTKLKAKQLKGKSDDLPDDVNNMTKEKN